MNTESRDFDFDARWFLSRGWKGGAIVIIAIIFVFELFNLLASVFGSDKSLTFLGHDLTFPAENHRVVFSAAWGIPIFIICALIILNRFVAYMLLNKEDGLDRQKRTFEFFVYLGEILAVIGMKYTGGVESPMCIYLVAHIVTLSSVVSRRSLSRHIAFLSVMIIYVAGSEYSGLITHTDITNPPLMLYRIPEFVYIIVMNCVGYMIYIGISSSNTFRKFFERRRALEVALKSRQNAELYLDLMSHDLTNHNQTILGNIGLLDKKMPAGDPLRKYIEACESQILKSERLISRVRALEAASAIAEENLKPVDVDACLAEALNDVKLMYPLLEATLPVHAGKATATDMLRTAFMNVMENAAQHNNGNRTKIDVSAEEQTIKGVRYVKVKMADHGPGIPDDMKEIIFNRYTGEGCEIRIGTGMSLSKIIMERFGGDITVEDRVKGEPGLGSSFIFHLRKA